MEALKEITVWKGIEYAQPNHIYLMEGDKAYAYIKFGKGPAHYFKQPLRLDKRGRKFERASIKLFKAPKVESARIEVKGSKDNVYYVDPETSTCTCPGFTFRGNCKHLSVLQK